MMYARILKIWPVPAGHEELVKEKNNEKRRNILMNNNCVLRQENTT